MSRVKVLDDGTDGPDGSGGEPEARSATGAQTLERGLDLLELAAQEPMSIPELTRHSGLRRTTVYRLVYALLARGYLISSSDGRLRGGAKLLQLGHATSTYSDVASVAAPFLEELAKRTGLSAFLARRDGDYSVHLLRAAGTERIAVTSPPGTRRQLPETGLGKTLMLDEEPATWARLFGLGEAKTEMAEWQKQMRSAQDSGVLLQQGYGPDFINSVCAPVRNPKGEIVAAVNVAAAAQYLERDHMERLRSIVADTARLISAGLGSL